MAVRIGLVGTGTVGGGCLDILANHAEDFKRHYGIDIELVRVCSRNPEQAIEHNVQDIFTQDYHDIVDDESIDLVIELIGGTTVAHDVVCDALRAGKYVVTANKALMATSGEEIFELANEAGVEIAFEASVGGGIPIIAPLQHSLISNEISTVMGIVNGTTNYMLTRIAEDGLSYGDALREAQEKGFAEADPTADVDGLDAAAKIAILASLAFNSRVVLGDVYAEGIRNIAPVDLEMARDMGYCVKLLAIAHRGTNGIDVRVHPTMLPLTHPLATVNGVFNAIYVIGDAVGETMFFGEGAGAGPAASAVMGDVLELCRHIQYNVPPIESCPCADSLPLVPVEELSMKYYLRFTVPDRLGVMASTAAVFADHNVSLYSVMQHGANDGSLADIIYITHSAREKDIRGVIDDLRSKDNLLCAEPVIIRVED